MGDSESFDVYLARCDACKSEIAALLGKYGVDTCSWALDSLSADRIGGPARKGRKLDFDVNALRDIWVFVESQKRILKLSANAICSQTMFSWRSPTRTKVAKGATLRRRYQQAVEYLREESIPCGRLADARGDTTPDARISPTELWWRKLVEEEVSRCAELKRK